MDDILTPSQVAALLKIHVRTLYRLAGAGDIPGTRIGRSWRFNGQRILALVSATPKRRTKRNRPLRNRESLDG